LLVPIDLSAVTKFFRNLNALQRYFLMATTIAPTIIPMANAKDEIAKVS
jgi:hypothetical protein